MSLVSRRAASTLVSNTFHQHLPTNSERLSSCAIHCSGNMKFESILSFSLAIIQAAAQGGSSSPSAIFNQTGRLPDGCVDGYQAGTDTVLFTVPYTYQQVLSIIGSYQNITWSGSPPDTVTLNGTDNTIGTARTYDIAGAHVIETITVYEKPAAGPYEEIHTLAPLTIPAANVSFYGTCILDQSISFWQSIVLRYSSKQKFAQNKLEKAPRKL